jgi:two-component system, OmpR family, sensor histidine kinase KdpD
VTITRTSWSIAGACAAVATATGLVYALKPIAPVLGLGVLYVLAVLVCAVLFGAAYAIAAAFGSMLAFNFLFLPPVHTLTLADARNWTALGVYLTTAVVASHLATSARRRAVEAEQREREAALLADAAAAVLREEPLDEIRHRADLVLDRGGELAHARFEAGVASLLALAAERRDVEAVRRSDAIKTVILQTVSHDFRTPIATIRTAVDGLRDGHLVLSPADRGDLLEAIALEVARLSRLVENVLDLSRLEGGAAAPHPAIWDVDDLLAQAVGEVQARDRIRVADSSSLPPVSVDAVQLQRVLVNLLENALKFSTDDVELRAAERTGEVVIEVLDRGRGVAAEPTAGRGLGLGLAIARGFTEANGGSLELVPREGGGTTARVSLPAQRLPAGVR